MDYLHSVTRIPHVGFQGEVGNEGDEASVEEEDQPRLENALSSQLRHLMRHTPHPVAILTTTTLTSSPSSSSSPASTATTVHGLTLSSLTPLSLDPNPLFTFNIRLPSSTYDTLMKSHSYVSSSSTAVATKGDSPLQPHFNIHLLSATPAAAALAKRFSRPLTQTPQSYSTISPSSSPSSSTIPSDAAMLSDADPDPNLTSNKSKDADTAASGIRATLQCALRGDGLKVADHVVLVAEVLGVELVGDLGDGRGRNYPNKKQKQEEHEIEDEAVGMVYAKGRFWALAERPVGDA
ncbi:MAG: hypothetical protein M1825_000100 [Sarcosagium campestre]|nr:MAG: hypothetical protein M1825_000100 [Sarcosagium campestre]